MPPRNYGIVHEEASDEDIEKETKSESESAEDMLTYAISTDDEKLKKEALKLLKERLLEEALKKGTASSDTDDKKFAGAGGNIEKMHEDNVNQIDDSLPIEARGEKSWVDKRVAFWISQGVPEKEARERAVLEAKNNKNGKRYTGSMTYEIESGVVNPMKRADGSVEN